jgi:hypothetical protein
MHAFCGPTKPGQRRQAPGIAVTFENAAGFGKAFEHHGEKIDVLFASEDRRLRFRTLERLATGLRHRRARKPARRR